MLISLDCATLALTDAVRQVDRAKRERDEAITVAYHDGFSTRKIAALVGLSHQRVYQIVAGYDAPSD